MKKILFSLLISLVAAITTKAQSIAVIDTKYILSQIPEYKEADGKLQQIASQWQKQIDRRQIELDAMRKNFESEKYMLSDELKKKRELEIENSAKDVKALQQKFFGYEGELFKQRKLLVQPVQDRLYNAVQQLAVSKGYNVILDKSEGITVLYADPKLLKNDEVLKLMGIKK